MTNELIPIAPEAYEILQVYLSTQSIPATASQLGINPTLVSQYLNKPEVKRYLDHLYISAGYRNRDKIAETMDSIIEAKLSEMVETGLGSSKDIADLLALSHKFRIDEMKMMMELEKDKTPKNQTNVQINSAYGDGNYGQLLAKLLDK